ncbi:ribosome maturation factor RimP [Rubrivirga sp.]|uniref:ribosome maturation factor RimP n=1 Tax=Rubrivirga sp. TaxID=1885344 RepID=UPI003B51FF09
MPAPLPATSALADRIEALAVEAAADTDLFVVGVEVRGFQGSRVVEVFADAEAGAGADDLAALSRSLGFLLDTEDVVKGRYRLDVSTPGAERPLVDVRQYAQHVGRTLALSVEREQDQLVTVQGELLAVEDGALVLDGETAPIPFDSIREARVTLPW